MKRLLTLKLWLFGLAYTLPVYDKYWAPFDEGIIAVAAQRLLAGEMPYRDFFIVMYPPGQIYALAALFKLFSGSLVAGRIYAVLVSVSIAMLVFLIARALTKHTAISVGAYLIMLTALAPRLGAIPAPVWPGMMLALMTIYLFIRYLDKPGAFLITAAGAGAGITALFRHDIGFSVFISILIPLVLTSFRRSRLRDVIFFVFGASVVTLPWVLYFIKMSAVEDLFNSLIAFPFVHEKTAIIPFPRPCFDLKMIFHQSLYFININQFYIPLIAYSWSVGLIIIKFFRKQLFNTDTLALIALSIFGFVTYKEVAVRADPAHLLSVIAPAVIISAYIAGCAFSSKFKPVPASILKYAVSALLIFLFILLFIKNTDKYLKNGYTKPLRKDTIKTSFDAGAIYIPKDERQVVIDVIKFIKENTAPGERIYIGNLAHWKDDFGGSLLIYYLADRLPAVKYYELLPGLVTDKRVQEENVQSLIAKNARLVILQDIDLSGAIKESAPEGSLVMDDFIARNYTPVQKIGKFNLYKRVR